MPLRGSKVFARLKTKDEADTFITYYEAFVRRALSASSIAHLMPDVFPKLDGTGPSKNGVIGFCHRYRDELGALLAAKKETLRIKKAEGESVQTPTK